MIAQGPCDSMLSKKGNLRTIKGKSPNLERRAYLGSEKRVLEDFKEEDEEEQELKTIRLLEFLLPCSCFWFTLLCFLSSLCYNFLV